MVKLFQNITGKSSTRHYIILILTSIVVSFFYLKLFSFQHSEDSKCWIATANYFVTFNKQEVSHHCLFNPAIPFIAQGISILTFTNLTFAYLLINLISLSLSSLLIYQITTNFFDPKTSLITSLLFLTNYMTIYYLRLVQPDLFTWFVTLFLINIAVYISKQKNLTNSKLILFAIISTTAILTKMNLGFLLPSIALIIFFKHKNGPKTAVIYSALTLIPVIYFYIWAAKQINAYPWTALETVIQQQHPTFINHVTQLFSAFLYLWPFIIISLFTIQIKKYKSVIFLILSGLLIPIFIWPFVSHRFYFSLFPILLPLTAIGIQKVNKHLTQKPSHQDFLNLTLTTILALLSLIRVNLTLTHQSHLQFIQLLLSN